MDIWDAIVIGGGPAGSIAGLSLAHAAGGNRARKIAVSAVPRRRIAAARDVRSAKRPGLDAGIAGSRRMSPNSGRNSPWETGEVTWRSISPMDFATGRETFNIERSVFDAMLLPEASEGGAEVREGVAVKQIVSLADGDVRILTDAGEIRGRYLLDASGQGTVIGAASENPQAGGGTVPAEGRVRRPFPKRLASHRKARRDIR